MSIPSLQRLTDTGQTICLSGEREGTDDDPRNTLPSMEIQARVCRMSYLSAPVCTERKQVACSSTDPWMSAINLFSKDYAETIL